MRHFFGTPREDLFSGKDIISDIKAADEKDSKLNPLKNSLLQHLDKICGEIHKLCTQKKYNLLENFKQLDPQSSGMVNTIKFEFVLVEKLGIELSQCGLLIKILDHQRQNMIRYSDLLSWIQGSDNIQAYFAKILST